MAKGLSPELAAISSCRYLDWEAAMGFGFGPRRGMYVDVQEVQEDGHGPETLSDRAQEHLERFDLTYRSLCAALYNYAPTSGHPGGSISSGRIVASLLFGSMDYDVSDPDRPDADVLSYAAGHKALGLYALWALRNEILRIGAPDLLPSDPKHQLRLEDLLGFRRNPVTDTPLFVRFGAKPLDGHPTPATPFVPLATGASGVGVVVAGTGPGDPRHVRPEGPQGPRDRG
jgi:transketolase